MNKELSIVLLGRIEDAPYLEKCSGLVQVVERAIEGENNAVLYKKIPVSSFANAQQSQTKLFDMIPNSKYKGMAYFEDNGVSVSAPARNGVQYTSRLRLVCWLNTKLISGQSNMLLTAKVVNDLQKRLTGNPFNSPPFTRIAVTVANIPPQDKAIFSRYDYDGEVMQYLMAPYEFFALDLVITYVVPFACVNDIVIV